MSDDYFNDYEIVENGAELLVSTGLRLSPERFVACVERHAQMDKSIILKNMKLLKKKNPKLYNKAVKEESLEALKTKDATMLMYGKSPSNSQ